MKILAFKDPSSNTYDYVYINHNDCLHNRYKFRYKLHSSINLDIEETLGNNSEYNCSLFANSDSTYEPLSSEINTKRFQTLSYWCELGVGSTSMRQLKEEAWII